MARPVSHGITTVMTIADAARSADSATPRLYGARKPRSLRKIAKTDQCSCMGNEPRKVVGPGTGLPCSRTDGANAVRPLRPVLAPEARHERARVGVLHVHAGAEGPGLAE